MRNFVDFRSERSIWKIFLFLIVCFLSSNPGKAQYSFSAVKGVFAPLTNGTPVNSIQRYSSISGTIDIGFTFKFNGHPYDRLKASASGFITFKKFPTWDGMDSSVIAPLGFNALSGEKGNASYKTEGTAPDRVFTFEWLNWKWDWDAAQPVISFQVKLYETSNRIEFIYRQETGELNKPFARIGLMFQHPGKSIFLSDASENPKAYSNVSYYVYQKPATGQIYRFDELISGEPSNHVTSFLNEKSGSISLKWNDASGIIIPERYLILVSDKSFDEIKAPVDGKEVDMDLNLRDGHGAVYVEYGTRKFSGFTEIKVNSTYFFKIFPVNNFFSYTNYKTDGNVPQLKVNTSIDLSTVDVNIAGSVLTNTSNDIQYSINTTDGANGTWTDCDPVKTNVDFKTGGYDLWVRQKSEISNKMLLMSIAPQGNAPSFTINYLTSTTYENIPDNFEYSGNPAMNSEISGNGVPISLVPATIIYFRKAATKTEVASAIQTLPIPARPGAPAISIDFTSEKTKQQVAANVEFSSSIDMINPVSGSGEFINIIPGQTIYFRTKAGSTAFTSEILTLASPPRPSAPNFSIDFTSETTTQKVGTDTEYAESFDMVNSVGGNGTKLGLSPGGNYFFRYKATLTSFKSEIQHLSIPLRPDYPGNLTINDSLNLFDWEFVNGFLASSNYEYSIDNGKNWRVCSAKPFSVGNISIVSGDLHLRVRSTFSNFCGNSVKSSKAFTISTGILTLEAAGIKLYPNPANETIYLENIPEGSVISILTNTGRIIYQTKAGSEKITLPINSLHGLGVIKVKTPEREYQSKLLKY